MWISCDNCGKDFNKTPSKVKADVHNFCSQECVKEYRKTHGAFWRGCHTDTLPLRAIKALAEIKREVDSLG